MLLVCHDMYVLQAGDFYTFGTIVPRCQYVLQGIYRS